MKKLTREEIISLIKKKINNYETSYENERKMKDCSISFCKSMLDKIECLEFLLSDIYDIEEAK